MTRFRSVPLLSCAATMLIAADSPPLAPQKAVPSPSAPNVATASVAAPAGASAQSLPPATPIVRKWRPRPVAIGHVAAADRAATREPQAGSFINAVQIYPFSEGMIYRVYAAPERVTDIALQPGEALGAVAAGDTVRWTIGDTSSGTGDAKRTHILLKPFAAGLSTNVVITTDRRTYHLSLVSTSATAMAALSWTYPADTMIAVRRQQQQIEATAPVAQGVPLENLSFAYTISGDMPSWRPLRAFDDGRQTFIEFPANLGVGEAPPLFLLGAKGEAELVNYRVRGRFYIVDRLFAAAELRLGTKRQDIVRIAKDSAPVTGGGRVS